MEPKTRAELIAEWNESEHLQAAAPPPPAEHDEHEAPVEKTPPTDDVDGDVTQGIDAAKKAVAAVVGRQSEDTDKDADDTAVTKALQKAAEALTEAAEAQAKDNGAEAKPEPAKPDAAKPEPEADKQPPPAKPAEKLAAGVAETPPVADTDQNPPPDVEATENLGPAFSGVLVIENQSTGDGRKIAAEGLSWRNPPLPLMLLKTETHDPAGFDMNAPAVMAGRIDTLERIAGDGETQLIRVAGNFLANEDGQAAAELTEQMGRMGISADIAVQDREITITDADEYGFPLDGEETLTEGTIMGGTACPFPAFEGCYIVLGDGTDMPEAKQIPQAAEPPESVTAGGQLIHLMTFEECEACDEGLEVLVASGSGPVRPPASWFADPAFTPGDGRLQEIYGRNGRREGRYACPVTVTADGRVFGHIAPWGVCHTGKPGCVTAPPSAAGYAHFLRGQQIATAEGERVRVGMITAEAGHAPTQLAAAAAMSHYDDTATVVADVTVGDDEYGIWFAGAIRPDASEAQIRNLTAASLSGDWRLIGGQLELVAALAVPVPGFPIAVVASGHQNTLVAYGAQAMEKLKHRPPRDMAAIAQPALKRLAQRDARERIAVLG